MKDTKWIDDLEAAVPKLREFAETLRKVLVPNVTREFVLRVTLISPSEQEAEADLTAWIKIKNHTGTQINGSSLTFVIEQAPESWEEGPL